MSGDRVKRIGVIGLRGFPDVQGGVEKHCEALYPNMEGFTFQVYRRKPYLSEASLAARIPSIGFIDLPSGRTQGLEAFLHTFLGCLHLATHRVDAVHVHNMGPGLFVPLLKLLGYKVVLTYHSINYEHKKWGPAARLILRAGEWLSLTFSDRVIWVNGPRMAKVSAAVKKKSRLIYNGINSTMTPTSSTSYIESHGLRAGDYLLAVGRITPEKGFDWLVRAVDQLESEVRLVIAGGCDHDTAYLEQLKALDTKGRVIFTGNLQGEPLRQLYSHARLFVLSSVSEGFPLVLLEAMQYGLPVIASRIPATEIPQISDEMKFAPADTDSLAEALRKALSEPHSEPISYDLTDYDWHKIGRQTSEVFKSL